MADQIERLIEAVNDVCRKLTRLSTYENLIVMGRGSTAVSSAVSATLGLIKITKQLAGTCTATASLTGAMIVTYFLGGAPPVTAVSSASGSMENSKGLSGSVTGVSGVTTSILNSVQFAGSISAQSSVSGPPVFMQRPLAGVCTPQTIVGSADLQL